jgi:hypothetical protein
MGKYMLWNELPIVVQLVGTFRIFNHPGIIFPENLGMQARNLL